MLKNEDVIGHISPERYWTSEVLDQFKRVRQAKPQSVVREYGKLATCLREAASTGMEPLACQP